MRFSARPLIAATVLVTVLSTGACGSDDSAPVASPTSTPAPVTSPNTERPGAYKYFLSPDRTQKIDEAISACGDPLLRQFTDGTIPAKVSGGRKDELGPRNGLGLVYSDPSYVVPKGHIGPITLTVYFANGKATEVHGVEIQHDDTTYILRGWRVARADGRHTDNSVDAYTWEARTGDAQMFAVKLADAGTLTPSDVAGPISGSDNFDILHVGYSEEDMSNHFTAVDANKLQVLDGLFLRMFSDICK